VFAAFSWRVWNPLAKFALNAWGVTLGLAPAPRSNSALLRKGIDLESAERTLAVARVWISIWVMVAIYLDRSQLDQDFRLTQICVLSYVAYSILVLVWLRARQSKYAPNRSSWLHIGDVLWMGLLCLLTHSPAPVPLFLLFVLAASAHRWGFNGTLKTIAVCVAFLLLFLLLGSFDSKFDLWPPQAQPAPMRFGAAILYICMAGGLLGFLGRKERQLRMEASARAAQKERSRIAREIHDGVIQVLYSAECQIDVMRRQNVTHPSQINEGLTRVQKLLQENIVAVRELVQRYRPPDLGPQGLVAFVAELVQKFQDETGIKTQFISDVDQIPFPPSIRHELARIVQEALVNVRKHSSAHNVLVQFVMEKGKWKFVIDDDGCGFDFAGRLSHMELDAAGKGPVVIKERVHTIGGELSVESNPGHGSRLEIELSREVYG
jgi:signal transduction histidine kinase